MVSANIATAYWARLRLIVWGVVESVSLEKKENWEVSKRPYPTSSNIGEYEHCNKLCLVMGVMESTYNSYGLS